MAVAPAGPAASRRVPALGTNLNTSASRAACTPRACSAARATKQILATVSQELTAEFGAGFNYTSLTRMARFAEWMTNEQILATLSQTLSWSHFVELLPIKDPLARDFYAEMCRIERWDVRTLRRKISGMLYQRTALSKQPDAVIGAEIGQLRRPDERPDPVRLSRCRASGAAAT
jgi:hypothetical protein